jgi:hypothetical protein
MRGPDRAPSRKRTTRGALLAPLTFCLALAGCVESLPHTRLPELAKDPKPVLTPEQQKAATAEQSAARAARREEAMREIERQR